MWQRTWLLALGSDTTSNERPNTVSRVTPRPICSTIAGVPRCRSCAAYAIVSATLCLWPSTSSSTNRVTPKVCSSSNARSSVDPGTGASRSSNGAATAVCARSAASSGASPNACSHSASARSADSGVVAGPCSGAGASRHRDRSGSVGTRSPPHAAACDAGNTPSWPSDHRTRRPFMPGPPSLVSSTRTSSTTVAMRGMR